MMMSFTSDVTMDWNAPPMMNATASCTMLPCACRMSARVGARTHVYCRALLMKLLKLISRKDMRTMHK